jgi:hypothetical protein
VLAHQCTALMSIVDAVSKAETADRPLSAYTDPLMDAMKMGVHGFAYVSQARRENIIAEYGKPLATLCYAQKPVGESMLLACRDVCRKLKIKKLFKKSRFQGRYNK